MGGGGGGGCFNFIRFKTYLMNGKQIQKKQLYRKGATDKVIFFFSVSSPRPTDTSFLSKPEPEFVYVFRAQESIPRNRFRQTGNKFLGSLKFYSGGKGCGVLYNLISSNSITLCTIAHDRSLLGCKSTLELEQYVG